LEDAADALAQEEEGVKIAADERRGILLVGNCKSRQKADRSTARQTAKSMNPYSDLTDGIIDDIPGIGSVPD
jgi:hypothetical protein